MKINKSLSVQICRDLSAFFMVGFTVASVAQAGISGDVRIDDDNHLYVLDTSVTVSNAYQLSLSGATVGWDYEDGKLYITTGGSITTSEGMSVGENNSYGAVSVDGEDSELNIGDNLYMENADLNITNGGTLTTNTANIGGEDGISYAAVFGTGSTWNNNEEIEVGSSGRGELDILDDGYVSADMIVLASEAGGSGELCIEDGGTLESSIGLIGFYDDTYGVAYVGGFGSTWTTGSLYLGGYTGTIDGTDIDYRASGNLTIANGGMVTTKELYLYEDSNLTIDVGTENTKSTLDGGAIDNEGTIRLTAGASTEAGNYSPISYNSISGDGTVKALGGTWDEEEQTFTASEQTIASIAEGETSATVSNLDLSMGQRLLITDENSDTSVGAAFVASDTPTEISFTAEVVTDDTLISLLADRLDDDADIHSIWSLSAENYDDEVYLSLYAGDEDVKEWNLWYYTESGWTELSEYSDDFIDMSYDGTYLSATVSSLGIYAVVGKTSTVPVPGAAWLLGSGLLGLAGLRRRKQ
nr:VPLPA-CTERM sorting domain-containing protein [uncultured Desulfobacter sp.]